MKTVGLEINCKLCQQTFLICKSCYRGHLYCSTLCRDSARKLNRKKAQKKYEKTGKGKKKRARRQANYRKNQGLFISSSKENLIFTHPVKVSSSSHLIDQTPKKVTHKNKVTHTSSKEKKILINSSPSGHFSVQNSKQKCCICKQEIDRWEKYSESVLYR